MLDASHIARQFAARPAVQARESGLAHGPARSQAVHEGPSFGELLEQASSTTGAELKFSKHAQKRLASRNIDF
ncbi:MAG TPA: flagellar protein, partial [Spirochaetota bacterium]|nr:flagellar protein [Spirochaetota bacterium]